MVLRVVEGVISTNEFAVKNKMAIIGKTANQGYCIARKKAMKAVILSKNIRWVIGIIY